VAGTEELFGDSELVVGECQLALRRFARAVLGHSGMPSCSMSMTRERSWRNHLR
jgi:hypothetical protein